MYIVVDNIKDKIIIFREVTILANYLGVGRTTVYYWFKNSKKHVSENYRVYKVDEYFLNSNRGQKKKKL